LLTGSYEGDARLWDAATGEEREPLFPHQSPLRALAFSPDGGTVLTGGEDGLVRLWDAKTGQPGRVFRLDGNVRAAAVSPDGRLVLAAGGPGGGPGTARLWDRATGVPVGPPLRYPGAVFVATFNADGRRLFTGGFDGTARLSEVPTPLDGTPERITL